MDTPINPMEPFVLWCLKFEVDEPREPTQRAVQGDTALWLQSAAQLRYYRGTQSRRRSKAEADCIFPLIQRPNGDTADRRFGPLLDFGRFTRQQDRRLDMSKRWYQLPKRCADLLGLHRCAVGFQFYEVPMLAHPLWRPVLDLDDADAWGTDGDDVDFVRLKLVRD